MTEEDEAFNEIEQRAKQRKESVRATINKSAPTYFTDEHAISMTLRDYFASAAMQGLMSKQSHDAGYWHLDAKAAYEMADAMLLARQA